MTTASPGTDPRMREVQTLALQQIAELTALQAALDTLDPALTPALAEVIDSARHYVGAAAEKATALEALLAAQQQGGVE